MIQDGKKTNSELKDKSLQSITAKHKKKLK